MSMVQLFSFDSDGSGSIVHGGSSGSASYLSPDCNPVSDTMIYSHTELIASHVYFTDLE